MTRVFSSLPAAVIGLVLAGLSAGSADAGLREAHAAMVRENYAAVIREATPLAEAGDPDAAYMLGLLHLHGRGVTQSPRAAIAWFRRAAGRDHAAAQLYLGRLAMVGQGTTLDFVEAYKWFALAARNGNAAAKRMVPSIDRQLTPAQRAQAKARVAAWKGAGK
ncbi:MAG TPA: tetratricopeptide repeat protein [Alphaproteobacteria bacterium]|nr:tetratricopeptide repeat protein [Alphaproteobacteria bacterium]